MRAEQTSTFISIKSNIYTAYVHSLCRFRLGGGIIGIVWCLRRFISHEEA